MKLTSENKWTSFPTNDDEAYDKDDIKLEEVSDEPIFVLVPKLYCLEASLNFENGQPLYKWVAKDCNLDTSSSVCELSESLVEEETESLIKEPLIELENKEYDQNYLVNRLTKTDINNSKINDQSLVNEHVNNLVNQFLSEPSNKTKEIRKYNIYSTESNEEFETESSEDEHLKAILSDILKEDLMHSTTTPTTTSTTTLTATSTTPIFTSTFESTNSIKPTDFSNETTSTIFTLPIDHLNYLNILSKFNETSKKKVNEKDQNKIETCQMNLIPIINQIIFAIYIAFNCLCKLIVNLFDKRAIAINDVKSIACLFVVIVILLIVLSTVLIVLIVMCKYILKIMRRKRKLLLEQLSEQRNGKDFSVTIDKSYDNSCYYNIPQNRNIYVSNPAQLRPIIENSEKYKSIPKEYFY